MINLGSIIKKMRTNKSNNYGSRAKCFSEDLNYEGPFEYIERGVSRVPLNQIVGSVGKCSAFNSEFKPRSHVPQDRLSSIRLAMHEGKLLPPVQLYKVNSEYYVMDGNHRVAVAKELNRFEIMAKIVELIPTSNTCCISGEVD